MVQLQTNIAGQLLALSIAMAALPAINAAEPEAVHTLRMRISWGHRAAERVTRSVQLVPGAPGVAVSAMRGADLEPDDHVGNPTILHAGAGDIDAVECEVTWKDSSQPPRKSHSIWNYLLQNGEPGQIARLKDDVGLLPGAPIVTVQLAADGTSGFSIALEQLQRHKAIWLKDHDCFIALTDAPEDLAAHLASLRGERVLDRVKRGPDATLQEYNAHWEDMGNPDVWNKPWETHWLGTRGHIVGTVGRYGSLYKFGIDRYAGVRPDFASPHKFRFDPKWTGAKWTGQRLTDGLPVLVTRYTRDGQHCEFEQFAAPRDSASAPRGEQPMVLFTKATLSGAGGPVKLGFRLTSEATNRHVELKQHDGVWCVFDRERNHIWLTVEPGPGLRVEADRESKDAPNAGVEIEIVGDLPAGARREIVLKLPSPAAPADAVASLAALDFTESRAATLKYWEDWLAAGARFDVPEPKVNELFRANLWHALRLPRFRTGGGADQVDLPYSNFAYGQTGTPWPVNQAVYVDYMLYDLRGHHAIAEEELGVMYRNNQETNGHVGGFANWGVYTPGMIYSVAQHYLLSGDRASFEKLLPQSLHALDWCLDEIKRAQDGDPATPGLILAPLNDLSHAPRSWAFNQAYFVAGVDLLGHALADIHHPRATECRAAAQTLRAAVEREFARASVKAPAVQLADGTWNNYVPCDAITPRRLLDQWYPTDVDTGPLHLLRLAAVDPRGWLATAVLHDHEDNLFLSQSGAINEPVYNMQGTAYLRRDEPEAAIRTFYSTMACAFSHSQLEPVEHRWAWPQYFGPPSTDGAWFELYRNLLLNELTGDSLFVGQAIPRNWLTDGKRIAIDRAPTYYGPVNLRITSDAASGVIHATVEFTTARHPATLLVRLRHPERKPIRSVNVNGASWQDFDPAQEWVRVPEPKGDRFEINARY